MGRAKLQAPARAQDPVEFLNDSDWVANVFDHVLHQYVIKPRIIDWIRELVEIMDDVGLRVGRDVEPDRARDLRRPTADIEHRPRATRREVELVWIS